MIKITFIVIVFLISLTSNPVLVYAQSIPFAFFQQQVTATETKWVGSAADSDWQNPANWSTGAVPNASVKVIFDGLECGVNCNVSTNGNISIKEIEILASYNGVITQTSTHTFSVGTGGWSQSSGTFTGSDSDITINGKFSLSTGSFTASSSKLIFGGSYTTSQNDGISIFSGTFNHNGSETIINSSLDNSDSSNKIASVFNIPSGLVLNDLTISVSDTNTLNGFNGVSIDITSGHTLTLLGDLKISNGKINNGTIELAGNYETICANATNFEDCAGGGSTEINFTGANEQLITIASNSTPLETNYYVNKTSGAVSLSTDLSLSASGQTLTINNGDWKLVGNALTVADEIKVGDGVGGAQTARLYSNCGTITAGSGPNVNATDGAIIAPATPNISIADNSGTEGNVISFNVSLSEVSCTDLTLNYLTVENTARKQFDSDYTHVSSTLTINAGTPTASIDITTVSDTRTESDETFFVQISNASQGLIIDNEAIGTIIDDDPTNFIWTGLGADNNWSTAANWSGGVVPTSSDVVIFDSTCTNCNSILDTDFTLVGLYLESDYTGTLDLGSARTLTTKSVFHQSGGTINYNDVEVRVAKSFEYVGGSYNIGTSTISGTTNVTLRALFGSFQAYNLKVDFTGTGGFVSVDGNALTVLNDLTHNVGYGPEFDVYGDVTSNGSTKRLSVNLVGNQNQQITATSSSHFTNLTITKTGGLATFSGTYNISKNFTYVSGNVDLSNLDLIFDANIATSIDANGVEFGNVTLSKSSTGNVSLVTDILIKGDLNTSTKGFYTNGRTVNLEGNFSSSISNNFRSSLVLSGTNDQTFSTTTGYVSDNELVINKPSGTVIQTTNVDLTSSGQDFNLQSGDWNMAGFDLNVNDTLTLNAGTTLYTNCGNYTYGTLVNNGTIVSTASNPNISINDASAIEGNNIEFTVSLSESICGSDFTIDYSTDIYSATSGDFTATSGTLTISSGNLSGSISVPTTDDTTSEIDEAFQLILSNNSHGAITDNTGLGTINDNDTSGYIWTGLAGDGLWSTSGNWSGNSVPGSSHTAFFDSTCTNCNVNINTNLNVRGIYIANDYTGTISQGSGVSITIGAAGYKQLGGTFVGSDSQISLSNNVSDLFIGGGSFTSTSGELEIVHDFSVSDPSFFNHNNGTVEFKNNVTTEMKAKDVNFFNLSFTKSSNYDMRLNYEDIIVLNKLIINRASDTGQGTIEQGYIELKGDLEINSGYAFATDTGYIRISGNTDQYITGVVGEAIDNLEIASTGGTVYVNGELGVIYNFIYTSGNVDWGSSKLVIGSSRTIYKHAYITSNGLEFGNVYLLNTSNYDIIFNDDMTINGKLEYDMRGSGSETRNNTVYLKGDVELITGLKSASTNFVVSGNTDQTLKGAYAAAINNLEIASTGGTVTFEDTFSIWGSFTYTSGTVDTTNSTIRFIHKSSTHTLYPGSMEFGNVILDKQSSSHHTSISGTMDINGDLEVISAGAGGTFFSGSVNLAGNYISTNTAESPDINLTFDGTGNQEINTTGGYTPNKIIIVNKASGEVVQKSNIDFSTTGQDLYIQSGAWNMAGYNLNVNDVLTLDSGTTLYPNCGTYTQTTLTNNGTIQASTSNPSINVSDATATEGGDLVFKISLSEAVCSFVTNISYTTDDNTATIADFDYSDNDSSVAVPAGTLETNVTVSTISDANNEGSESLFLNLVTTDQGWLNDNQGVGTIND